MHRPRQAPEAIFFDVGLTLTRINGDVLIDALASRGISAPRQRSMVEAAFQLAAEVDNFPFPNAVDDLERIAKHWLFLLGIGDGDALPIALAVLGREDLYGAPDAHATTVLQRLAAAGIPLGVISNGNGDLISELERFGLMAFFTIVLDSATFGVEKPSLGIFLAGPEALGLRPADCWYVGDGLINDVLGAAMAGYGRIILLDRHRVFSRFSSVERVTSLVELGQQAEASLAAKGISRD